MKNSLKNTTVLAVQTIHNFFEYPFISLVDALIGHGFSEVTGSLYTSVPNISDYPQVSPYSQFNKQPVRFISVKNSLKSMVFSFPSI